MRSICTLFVPPDGEPCQQEARVYAMFLSFAGSMKKAVCLDCLISLINSSAFKVTEVKTIPDEFAGECLNGVEQDPVVLLEKFGAAEEIVHDLERYHAIKDAWLEWKGNLLDSPKFLERVDRIIGGEYDEDSVGQ